MTDSLYTRLSSAIKPSTVTEIADPTGCVGTIRLAWIGTVGGSCIQWPGQQGRRFRDDASGHRRRVAGSRHALSSITGSQLSDSTSPLMSTGRRFLSSLFGGNQNWMTDLIGRESGLGSGAAATVLALGGNALLNFIGGKVRDEGMTATSLAGFLRNEAPAVRKMLPASFNDAFMRHLGGQDMSRTIEIIRSSPNRCERNGRTYHGRWQPFSESPSGTACGRNRFDVPCSKRSGGRHVGNVHRTCRRTWATTCLGRW